MALKWNLASHEEIVSKEFESSFGGDRWIQLPQRTRRRVPGIYKDLATNLLLLPIKRFKRPFRHHDFAAHFKICRQLLVLQRSRVNAQRNRSNGLHVRRHVLAGRPVSARHSAGQHSTFVLQRNAQSIELMLRNVFNFFLPTSLPNASIPIVQRLKGKRIVKTKHWAGVTNTLEGQEKLALLRHVNQSLRRRIGSDEIRVLSLQLF